DNFLIKDIDSIFIHESKRKNLGFWHQKNLLINCIYLDNNISDEKISKCFKKNKYKKINLANKSIYLISSFEKLQAIDERYLSFDNDIVFTPGPTSILSSTKKILGYGITHHRTETGILAIKTCAKNIKKSFNSKKGYPMIFVSSGMGVLDSAFENLVDSNSKILIINTGFFGQLLVTIAKSHNIDYVELKYENGFSYDLNDVKKYINVVDAIFVTYLETSTGVVNNIEALGKLCKNTKTLVVTDSISALINEKLNFDLWNIDFAIGSSTKGFETSPGIGCACVSQRAINRFKFINKNEFYFDWNRYILKDALSGALPATSPVNIISAMNESWKYIESKGGLSKIQSEKKEKWNYLFRNLKQIGFTNNVMDKNNYSNWLLTVKTPLGISAKFLKIFLYTIFGILIEVGINDETDSILRIAISMNTSQKDINYLIRSIKTIIK
ncbi:MAG: aminotransferase class V-fold PLP-dependent enzyme, partial [Malacoplasma sp.]|nr:aminotransferase class V-fold PLP-dependent enzyme [Malacoplasma sp.]